MEPTSARRKNGRLARFSLAIAAVALIASPASAEERATLPLAPPPAAFLHVDGATAPSVGVTVARSAVTISDAGSGARPFASDLGRAGIVYALGAEAGLTPWLSFVATGLTDGPSADLATASGMSAGARFAPFAGGATRLSLTVGALRELAGATGTFARIAFAHDVGRARLAMSAHGEHVTSPGRDGLDVMVSAGATYAIAGPLRIGVEYVGQDLEGALDPTELEGVRHFVGPTMALDLERHGLSLVAGPAMGLSPTSPRAVGRMAIAYAF